MLAFPVPDKIKTYILTVYITDILEYKKIDYFNWFIIPVSWLLVKSSSCDQHVSVLVFFDDYYYKLIPYSQKRIKPCQF